MTHACFCFLFVLVPFLRLYERNRLRARLDGWVLSTGVDRPIDRLAGPSLARLPSECPIKTGYLRDRMVQRLVRSASNAHTRIE